MKAENVKELIAYLTVAARDWQITSRHPQEVAAMLSGLATKAEAADDGEHLIIQPLDVMVADDPTPPRVLAACLKYEDLVGECPCDGQDLSDEMARKLVEFLRMEAINRV